MSRPARTGEFERIARLLAPLAADWPGAFGLTDDAALIALEAGRDLVVTTDTMVSGVHYVGDEPPDLIARKLLRVNLSDLAAMGARPRAYTLAMALPSATDDGWLEAFAAGLAADQALFGVSLIGGDSVSTAGPAVLTVGAFGTVRAGDALRRGGARPGDRIWVSGSVGDGALGLLAVRGDLDGLAPEHRAFLSDRYRLPRPRVALGPALTGVASAAMDVSDGLVGDLRHIAETSGVAAVLDMTAVPLSAAGRAAVGRDAALMRHVLTGGDDYELLFTAPPYAADRILALSTALDLPLTAIGRVEAGEGVRVLDAAGRPLDLGRGGYTHV
ncbi:MAG: thiamine-phosphate kinase [Alphaproteobacteria bacterium]